MKRNWAEILLRNPAGLTEWDAIGTRRAPFRLTAKRVPADGAGLTGEKKRPAARTEPIRRMSNRIDRARRTGVALPARFIARDSRDFDKWTPTLPPRRRPVQI